MSFATEPLQIVSRVLPGSVTMIVRGEIDVATAPQFSQALTDRLSSGPSATLCLDLSGVSFMDSAGLHAMVMGQRLAQQFDGDLVVTGTSPQVSRLLAIMGVEFPADACPAVSTTAEGPTTDAVADVPGWVQDTALLDAIAAAVVATDTTGTILYFNRAAERMYGYSPEEMLGANVMQLLVEPVDQIPAEEIMTTVLAGNRWSGHFRVRRKAADTTVVRITDTPIIEGGSVVGVIGVAEDLAGDPAVDQAAVTAGIESRAVQVADQMRQAMESRAVIEQAKGMLIAAHGCSSDEAFHMLSESSQRTNRKLRELATAMVEGARRTPKPGA
jgi:anti-anti-sigma factor